MTREPPPQSISGHRGRISPIHHIGDGNVSRERFSPSGLLPRSVPTLSVIWRIGSSGGNAFVLEGFKNFFRNRTILRQEGRGKIQQRRLDLLPPGWPLPINGDGGRLGLRPCNGTQWLPRMVSHVFADDGVRPPHLYRYMCPSRTPKFWEGFLQPNRLLELDPQCHPLARSIGLAFDGPFPRLTTRQSGCEPRWIHNWNGCDNILEWPADR